jgi:hypothetical protein
MTRAHASIIRETVTEYDSMSTTSALERLLAQGRIRQATLRLVDLGYPPSAPHDISISDALSDQRSER